MRCFTVGQETTLATGEKVKIVEVNSSSAVTVERRNLYGATYTQKISIYHKKARNIRPKNPRAKPIKKNRRSRNENN